MQEALLKVATGMALEQWLTIAGIAITLIGQVIAGTLFLSRMKEQLITLVLDKHNVLDLKYNKECGDLHEKLNRIDRDLTREINVMRRELSEQTDAVHRNVGESLSALRQHITDAQMWNRDHFVLKGDLGKDLGLLREALEAMIVTLTKGFERLEKRVDALQP